jgi:hypothetical protein
MALQEQFEINDINEDFFKKAYAKLGHRLNMKHLVMAYDCLKFYADGDIALTAIRNVEKYHADYFVCQMAHGDTDVLLGVSGNVHAMLCLAGKVAGEEFDTVDEDSYDALCEFANLVNGKFVTLLEEENYEMDMIPPMCCENCDISASGEFCVFTLRIKDMELDIISVVDLIPYMS